MNHNETQALTTILFTAYDRPKPDGIDDIWYAAMTDVPFDLARLAAVQLIQSSTFLPKVAEIRQRAADLSRERRRIAREAEERKEIEAYAANAGPLRDRSAEIQAFVGQVRTIIPDGDREALMPRAVAWEREHRHHQRQIEAVPNPAYDPTMQPVREWSATKGKAEGAWWEDTDARERHAKTLLAEAGRLRSEG
ncbi:hypothetical protein ABZ783_07150 [Micromonospora sp. NPDC047738]|uniref:hypothetical protein n=1 Tax=Micromonospora sp. NPDC047738 TaxID=3155741 RepID=UPI0033F65402